MLKIWTFIFISAIISAFVAFNPSIITEEIMNSSKTAVENVINLTGMICFWSGMFKILEKSSHIKKIGKIISKIIFKIMKKDELSQTAIEYISLNVATNMLGVGNAATVNGIRAMEEMQKQNLKEDIPSDNMLLFLIINTASLQIIPTTMISLRTIYGSNNPVAVILPVWIVSIISIILGILFVKIHIKKERKNAKLYSN